ncbi:MAG: hypothetical protein ABIR60_08715, partial [Allosphingosinicella sp.]
MEALVSRVQSEARFFALEIVGKELGFFAALPRAVGDLGDFAELGEHSRRRRHLAPGDAPRRDAPMKFTAEIDRRLDVGIIASHAGALFSAPSFWDWKQSRDASHPLSEHGR